jgi:GTP 3',8-cyclase
MSERTIPIHPVASSAAQRGLSIPPVKDAQGPARDGFDRPIQDLRISVTDRCNFRCSYCMPKSVFNADYTFLPQGELLSFEEIARLAGVFANLGVEKIRLTGGEPLLRRHLPKLIEMLAAQLPLVELTLTTNGAALAAHAQSLKDAGLQRITVSLDAMDDAIFRRMNDMDFPVAKVLHAIDVATQVGLAPVKVNMVVQKGVNDTEVVPMARHFRNRNVILRFIEFMDVGSTNGWNLNAVLPAKAIIERLDKAFGVMPLEPNYRGEVAERWSYRDGAGEFGVIASVTQPFCGGCTRARLSTDGQLYTCLFAQAGYDLRRFLREGMDNHQLREAILGVWQSRQDRYSAERTAHTGHRPKVEMSYIGG